MRLLTLIFVSTALGATLITACESTVCDPTVTRANPATGKEEGLIVGTDGMCHWPWYDEDVWGASCSATEDCGSGLICLAPDLPICTQINCNTDAKKDEVCGEGFICIDPGGGSPTVCIPNPAAGTGGSGSGTGGGAATGGGPSGGGAGGAGGDTGTGGTVEEQPNIGTTCSMAGDPVCTGGTICPAPQLTYCTVTGCATAGAAKDACDAAAGDGYTCMAGTPFPDDGICYK